MSCLLYNRGHLIVFLFYLTIGTAFFAISITYLANLRRIGDSLLPDPDCHPGNEEKVTNTHPPSDSTPIDCNHIQIWRILGVVCLVYSLICLLAAVSQMITMLKKVQKSGLQLATPFTPEVEDMDTAAACSAAAAAAAVVVEEDPVAMATTRSATMTKGTINGAIGGPALKRAQRHALKILGKKPGRHLETEPELEKTWLGCLWIWMEFFMVSFLLIATFVLPVYITCVVITSGSIRVKDEPIYGLSLAMLCVAIANLTMVAVSPVLFLIEEGEGQIILVDDLEPMEARAGYVAPQGQKRNGRWRNIFTGYYGSPAERESLIPEAVIKTEEEEGSGPSSS